MQALHHDRYKRREESHSPIVRHLRRPFVTLRPSKSFSPKVPKDAWWYDHENGYPKPIFYWRSRSVRTNNRVDISKLPYAEKRLAVAAAASLPTPPTPLTVPTVTSSEHSFSTTYPSSSDSGDDSFLDDAFIEDSSPIPCSDSDESLRPLTTTTTTIFHRNVPVSSTPSTLPTKPPSFLQRCWNWIDTKIRSWLF